METETKISKVLGISPELFWTISSAIVLGSFFLGLYIGQAKFDKEKSDYYEQNKILKLENESLKKKLDSCLNYKEPTPPEVSDIFVNGSLGTDLEMGVNTSEGQKTWTKIVNNELNMNYPKGQSWGAVFITYGKSSKIQSERKSKDFHAYDTLLIEFKGTIGTSFSIGLKDKSAKDDGTEPKYPINIRNNDWGTCKINLRKVFDGTDLNNLYVVTEFVFGSMPGNLCVRKIQFK